MIDSTKKQNLDNLRSEIRFREKLARQHVTGEVLIKDYVNKPFHDVIMRERVAATFDTMKKLKESGVFFDPFIELGAERGQRSLVLTNDFNAQGFAVDISFAQLKTLDYWMKFFEKSRGPIRVCCDAYHLPFQRGSLNFAFCYQFLHHFPTPVPIVKEINRVLSTSTGYFYFDEEPYKRFSLKLYRRKKESKHEPGKLKKYLNYIESFIADFYETEEEHGIIENDEISLEEWVNFMEIFEKKKFYLHSASLFFSEMEKASPIKIRLHKMLGGIISGLVKKKQGLVEAHQKGVNKDIYDLLGCPVCVIPFHGNSNNNSNNNNDRAPLVRHRDYLTCESCGVEYPVIDNVMLLLPQKELKELYPQFVR